MASRAALPAMSFQEGYAGAIPLFSGHWNNGTGE